MLIGRTYEYAYLEEYMKRPGSQLVVFYGQKFMGKTAFLLDFCKDRPFSYCLAKPGNEQSAHDELQSAVSRISEIESEEKKILIVDEFQFFSKDETFMPFCLEQMETDQWLIVLVSSAIHWVETSMVKTFGKSAARINGFHKCKELKFSDICKLYPDYPKTNLFILYSILGGIPGLWNFLDMSLDVRANIEQFILSDRSYMRHVGYLYCMESLRESGVYDTILSAMAQGNTKLNDLNKMTGYSRAKISVYLKTLMEQEQIEKVYSIECDGAENAKKGIYEIYNSFTDFWFTFIYPHEKELMLLTPEEYYDRYIKEHLLHYCEKYLKKIVKEYMILTGVMPHVRKAVPSRFPGKKHEIDIVWKKDEQYTVVWCPKLKAMVTYDDYTELQEGIKEAGIKLANCYVVSYKQFDEKLTLEARMKESLHLLTLEDIMQAFA
ncbi:MAG: ATP-binding protein [Lachnospiraceae bacterium]|nr:ATP-binding protein [Lachnospiraceae bacterium]